MNFEECNMREIGLVIFNCLPGVELDLIMSHNGGATGEKRNR